MSKRTQGVIKRKRADGSIAYMIRPPDGRGGKLPGRTYNTQKEALDALAEFRLGRYAPKVAETCDQFAERWTTDYPLIKRGRHRGKRKRESTLKEAEQSMKPFLRKFRGVPLNGISKAEARQFALEHPQAARIARAILNDAVADDLIPSNPFVDVVFERKDEPIFVPTAEDVARLEQAALDVHGPVYGAMFRAAIRLSADVGLRKGELCALQWEWIDQAAEEVTVKASVSSQGVETLPKNGTQRRVVMPRSSLELLLDLPRRLDMPYVVTNKRGHRLDPRHHYSIWNPVRTAAGLPHMRWHALRHYCATVLWERHRSVEHVAAQLGHEDLKEIYKVTRRYMHPDMQRMLDEIKAASRGENVVSFDTRRHIQGADGA